MLTHYAALHITEDASPEVVRAAYKALAQKWHPDKYTGAKEHAELRFKTISAAYEVLSSPELRAVYDDGLRASRAETSEATPETGAAPSPRAKDSILNSLWSGKTPPWKVFWFYIVCVPPIFLILASKFGKDGSKAAFASWSLVVCYMFFIHVCLWKSSRLSSKGIRRFAIQSYSALALSSPAWIFAYIAATSYYDQWSSERLASESSKPWEKYTAVIPEQKAVPAEPIYAQAPSAGEVAKRQVAVAAADSSVQRTAAQPVNQAELQEFNKALASVYAKYPFLNYESPSANQTAINAVIASTNGWIAKGYTRANSLIYAADVLAPIYSR